MKVESSSNFSKAVQDEQKNQPITVQNFNLFLVIIVQEAFGEMAIISDGKSTI